MGTAVGEVQPHGAGDGAGTKGELGLISASCISEEITGAPARQVFAHGKDRWSPVIRALISRTLPAARWELPNCRKRPLVWPLQRQEGSFRLHPVTPETQCSPGLGFEAAAQYTPAPGSPWGCGFDDPSQCPPH